VIPLRSTAIVLAVLASIGVAGAGVGCGGDDQSAEKARQKTAAEQARKAREAERARDAQRARERRARARRRKRKREAQLRQQQATAPAPSPTQQAPSSGGTPSADTPEGKKLLQQSPDCKNKPPPPPDYHGPVQC
jgi:hypothetical protein